MDRKKFSISKSLPILLVVIVLIASFFASISFVNAGSSFKKNSDAWSGTRDEIEANSQTYPYSSETANISSVSMDIIYGISKGLVTYHGELPYKQTHKNNDDVLDGWAGYPYNDTDYSDTNFWGKIPSEAINGDSNFVNKATVEKINDEDIVSLRLYALSHTRSSFNFGNALYSVMRVFAWIASMLVTLVVTAKNLDMDFILEALHLETLADLLTKNFIFDSEKGTLSIFAGFCIIMLIIALVGYGIRYVKGSEKTSSIWNIVITAFLGAIVVGMCLSGKQVQLGSTLSNGVSKLLYTVTDALNDGDGNAFKVEIEDEENENKIVQLSELAMIYKPYIDIQICTQFGIEDIESLDFSKFNADTSTLAEFGTDASDYNNNLGYYYWFANSSAKEKTASNKTIPLIGAGAAEDKLSSIITYMQTSYNNETNKSVIIDMINGISKPNGAYGAILMLAFSIVMVLLGVVLVKYALNVVIAKIEMFVGLAGLAIAGPLIITNKKKLVDTGKFIIGMLLVSIIEITIWSVFFDLIIYTTAVMLSANIGRILVTIAFLLLFLKFNPAIAQKIKQIMDRSTNAISPTFHQGRNALKQKIRQLSREGLNKLDNSQKIVGYDSNNNAITESRKGGLASRMAHLAANSLEDANQRKSWSKLNSEANEARQESKRSTAKKLSDEAESKVKKVEENIDSDAERTQNQINADTERDVNDAIETDVSGNFVGFNMDKLNDEEANNAVDLKNLEDEEKALRYDPEYRELLKEQQEIEEQNKSRDPEDQIEMDSAKLNRLKTMQSQIADRQKAIYDKKQKITASIRNRSKLANASKYGVNVDIKDGENIDDAIHRCTKIKAQQNRAEEYEAALQQAISAHAAQVDHPEFSDKSKIGKNKKASVNRTAVIAQATAAMKLEELKAGESVSTTEELKEEAKGIADIVEKNNESLGQTLDRKLSNRESVATAESVAAVRRAKAEIKQTTMFSKERREARERYKQISNDAKAGRAIHDENAKNAADMVKAETGTGHIVKTSTHDQINSLVRLNRTGDVDIRTSAKVQSDVIAEHKEMIDRVIDDTNTYVKETTENINNPEATRKSVISNAEARAAEKSEPVVVETSEKKSIEKPVEQPVVQTYTESRPATQSEPVKSAVKQSTTESTIKKESKSTTYTDSSSIGKNTNQTVETHTVPVQETQSKSVNEVINKREQSKPVVTESSEKKSSNIRVEQPNTQTYSESKSQPIKTTTVVQEPVITESHNVKTSTPPVINTESSKPKTTVRVESPIKSTETSRQTYQETPQSTNSSTYNTNSQSNTVKSTSKPVVEQSNHSTTSTNSNIGGTQTVKTASSVIEKHESPKSTKVENSKPITVETPKQSQKPVIIESSNSKSTTNIEQPKQTQKPVVVEQSAPTSKPVSVETPKQTQKPVSKPTTVKVPKQSQKPVNTSVSTETPKQPQKSVVVESPKSNPKPVVVESPKQQPVEQPVKSSKPVEVPKQTTTQQSSKPVIRLNTPKADNAMQKAGIAQSVSNIANEKKNNASETLKNAQSATVAAREKRNSTARGSAEREQADKELRMAKAREKQAEKNAKKTEKTAKKTEKAVNKIINKQSTIIQNEVNKSIVEQSVQAQQDIRSAQKQRTTATTRQAEIEAVAAAQEAVKRQEQLNAMKRQRGIDTTPIKDAVSADDLSKHFDDDLAAFTSSTKKED